MLLCRYFVLAERERLYTHFFYFRLLLLLIFPPSGESGGGEDNHFNRVGLFKTKIIKRGKKKRIWFDWNLHKDVMLYSRLILNLYTDNHFLLILLLLCRRQGESIWLLTQLVCWLFALLPTIALGGAGWSPIYLKFTRDYLKFTETFFFALMMGIDRHFLSFLKISVDKSKGHTKNEKWPINAR